MEASNLIAEAELRCGLTDWGGEALHEASFRELFVSLVNAIETESQMTVRGRLSAELRLPALLDARLSLVEERKRNPEIGARKIERPLFVLGLPRTGSSFLQALLAQDPDHIAPTTADFFFPSALQAWQRKGQDTRLQRTHEIQQALGMFDPDIQAMHPWSDTQPEECMFGMELAGWSEQLSASWRVPGYNRLRGKHLDTAFAMHRTVLQHLQHRLPGRRFALKSPGHLLRLPALLAAYPDAMIVQTHRDPARVLPSVTAFLVALRNVCCESRAPGEKIARVNLAAFADGLKQVIEFRRTSGREAQFHDALFTDIVRDPIGSVRAIYDRFNLPLSDRAVSAMQAWLDNPANNTPRGRYTLAQYGLDEAQIDEHFGDYMAHYAIPSEHVTAGQRSSSP